MSNASGEDDNLDIVAIAQRLYALPPASFTAERNAMAKSTRGRGERELAQRITALAKPSASASLINRLVSDGDEVQRVLELGSELRDTHDAPDRQRLRALNAERRRVIADITAMTLERAQQDGRTISATVVEEFEETLRAALADEAASLAIQSGRLLRALKSDGFEPVDVADAVAAGPERPRRSARASKAPRAAPSRDARTAHDEQQRARAEQQLTEAQQRAVVERQTADGAIERVSEAETLVAQRSETAVRLRAQLDELLAKSASADDDLAAAEQAFAAAKETAAGAAAAADAADGLAEQAAAALHRLESDQH